MTEPIGFVKFGSVNCGFNNIALWIYNHHGIEWWVFVTRIVWCWEWESSI